MMMPINPAARHPLIYDQRRDEEEQWQQRIIPAEIRYVPWNAVDHSLLRNRSTHSPGHKEFSSQRVQQEQTDQQRCRARFACEVQCANKAESAHGGKRQRIG
jgi:hypothetical protein